MGPLHILCVCVKVSSRLGGVAIPGPGAIGCSGLALQGLCRAYSTLITGASVTEDKGGERKLPQSCILGVLG